MLLLLWVLMSALAAKCYKLAPPPPPPWWRCDPCLLAVPFYWWYCCFVCSHSTSAGKYSREEEERKKKLFLNWIFFLISLCSFSTAGALTLCMDELDERREVKRIKKSNFPLPFVINSLATTIIWCMKMKIE